MSLNVHATVSNKVIAGTIANSCFEQGEIITTGRALDLGIGGEGWIPLQEKTGILVFTRQGSFGMNKDGDLMHLASELPVITFDAEGRKQKINLSQFASKPLSNGKLVAMFFTEVGSLEALYSDGKTSQIANLMLAAFENQRKLKLIDPKTHIFSAPKSVGEIAFGAAETAPFGKIFDRALELVPVDRYKKLCN